MTVDLARSGGAPAPLHASPVEWAALSRALDREAGLRLDREVAERLRWRLGELLASLGLSSARELVRALRGPSGPEIAAALADTVANQETSFFRGDATWGAIGERLLPDLLEHAPGGRPLRFWSAACATGQEAYSLAILARERLASRRVEILATDLSASALERARAGWFAPHEVCRGLTPARLRRHFRERAGRWQIRPELRAAVSFRRLNLARPWPFLAPFDLILLRHVLVHLTAHARAAVLGRLRGVLRPGGYLVLGVGETAGPAEGFEPAPLDPSGSVLRPLAEATVRSAR